MGNFREQGRRGVDEIKENSRNTLEAGEKMNEQATEINRILESINLQDNEDVEAIRDTGRNYQGSFDNAFSDQVETANEQIEQQGEQINNEMGAELNNVENGMRQLEQAGGVSDIGRENAEQGRSKLENSAREYQEIMNESDSVVNETAQQVNNLKNNLGRIFG